MKKLATVATLATLIAAPAFAQQSAREFWTPLESNAVIANGEVIGQDPDINVRLDLLRQAEYYANHKGD